MSDPKLKTPGYHADEEHDGKTPQDRARRQYGEPEQPDTDPQSGSGTVDLDDAKPEGATGADAENHGSA